MPTFSDHLSGESRRTSAPGKRAWRRFCGNRFALGAAAFLLSEVAWVWLWSSFSLTRPDAVSNEPFQSPRPAHWFGTDVHGRDLMSRVVFGTRISLWVGVVGACVSLFIGVSWGAVAGYVGGRIDGLMMRTVDVLYALPSIVLVIVLTAVFETSVRNWALRFLGFLGASANGLEETTRMLFLFVGLGSVSWLTMARVVRGQVLFLRKQTYVQASRLLGASHARILVRHILPNVSGVIVVHLMLTIPSVILYESFLSYLGLGVRPPEASLGSLMAEGVQQINALRVYWWLIAFPAGVLIVTLMALNYVGDGLRDALDPRADP